MASGRVRDRGEAPGTGRHARLARAWRRDQRGATAVEFAFVAPVFLILVFGIIETGLVFVGSLVLDGAVAEAARTVRTGQPQGAGTTDKDFRTELCDRLALMTCTPDKLYVDVKTYPSFAEMDLRAPLTASESYSDAGAYEFGTANEIVVVRAFYKWPTSPILNVVSFGNLSSGERLLASFAAFRNEPFPQTARK